MPESLMHFTTDELIEKLAAFKHREIVLDTDQVLELEDVLSRRQTNSTQTAKIIGLLLKELF